MQHLGFGVFPPNKAMGHPDEAKEIPTSPVSASQNTHQNLLPEACWGRTKARVFEEEPDIGNL
ncbi:hypothetical protein U1Q18_007078, partial [Sarracenia purpurea var. burkii]